MHDDDDDDDDFVKETWTQIKTSYTVDIGQKYQRNILCCLKNRSRAIAGRTARCRCKFRQVSNFYNGIARFLCHSTAISCKGLHQRPFKCSNYTKYTLIFTIVMQNWSPLHNAAHVWVNVSRDLKLFGPEIFLEVFQPVWKTHLNVTDGQTTYCGITALRSIAR